MKITKDYKHWIETKADLIEKLQSTEALIFNRIEPVYNTLEYYKKKELSEQEHNIFDVGYMYLAEQFLTIENYIQIFGSLESLEEQSVTFNYLMDITDFSEDYDLEHDEARFKELIVEIEQLLLNKQPLSEMLYEQTQDLINEYKDSNSIIEIFEEIADSLGV